MIMKVKVGDRFFEVEITDLRERPIRATVEGETFEVWPEARAAYTASMAAPHHGAADKPAVPVPSAAPAVRPSAPSSGGAKVVRAPIPGVISAILVQPGDEVTVGQELCKLDAMKMNNSIRANRAGKIAAISVSVGQTVKHNDPLIEYAD